MQKRTRMSLGGLLMIAVFGLCVSAFPVSAKDGVRNNLENIPQKDGVYDVPNHPGMKVRVFVHYAKANAKPAPTLPATCSYENPDSGSVVDSAGWHLPNTWTYTLNTASAPRSIGATELKALTEKSFAVWTGALGGKVTITSFGTSSSTKANSDDGINLIAWGVTPSNALGVTYTMYYTNSGLVVGVDTIMNSKVLWSWSDIKCNPNAYDAQNILTHELGHWMGLNDYYTPEYVDNTMYGYGSKGETKKDTLTTGDILGVQKIYPVN